MIDIEELHDKMVSYILVGFSNSGLSPKDAIEILNRLRQAEKDAARYRWLRDSGVENLFSYQQDMRSKYWDEDIDAEIGDKQYGGDNK